MLFQDEDEPAAADPMDQSTRAQEEESFQYARPAHVLILDQGHDAIAINRDVTGYDEPSYAILSGYSVKMPVWKGVMDRPLSYMEPGIVGGLISSMYPWVSRAVYSCFRDYYYVLLFIV